MVATVKATAKKPTAAKKKAAKRKSRPVVKKKTPVAKKLAVTGKAGGNEFRRACEVHCRLWRSPRSGQNVASHCPVKKRLKYP